MTVFSLNFATILLMIHIHQYFGFTISRNVQRLSKSASRLPISLKLSDSSGDWDGEVVSNSQGGRMQGCSIEAVNGMPTQWKIQIDGQQADLGKFSEAIYRKITSDAKQQRFQGFRPGTIPPHLLGTYVAFAMDECAREATLEAMQQNNIRPFDDARTELKFEFISILPPKKKAKKKKRKRKPNINTEGDEIVDEKPKWVTYDTMKEAIDAGWKPGQSFSFIASNCKGQKLLDQSVEGAKVIGEGGSTLNFNN